jgi:hypothetical protein
LKWAYLCAAWRIAPPNNSRRLWNVSLTNLLILVISIRLQKKLGALKEKRG